MEYSIYRLFGSKTRTSLLATLLMNESKRFYISELSRKLGIPNSMLIKEIANLKTLDIIKTERVGKLKFVQINPSLPYMNALKEIMIKTAGFKDLICEQLSNFSGIKYCLIFGSFANNSNTSESDVDVLIVGDASTLELAKPISDIEDKTGREINYVVWSEDQFMKRVISKNVFLSDIISKRIIMVIGSEDEFRRDANKGADQKIIGKQF